MPAMKKDQLAERYFVRDSATLGFDLYEPADKFTILLNRIDKTIRLTLTQRIKLQEMVCRRL